MEEKTLGKMIAALRKENGLTQLELAEKMGVTDKAVSKWERDASCPDISTIPKLAELFDITVDELMQVKAGEVSVEAGKNYRPLIQTILKAVALAMGVAVVTLNTLKELDFNAGMGMLGLGLACLAAASINGKEGQ